MQSMVYSGAGNPVTAGKICHIALKNSTDEPNLFDANMQPIMVDGTLLRYLDDSLFIPWSVGKLIDNLLNFSRVGRKELNKEVISGDRSTGAQLLRETTFKNQ